jgi:hypothetical protein
MTLTVKEMKDRFRIRQKAPLIAWLKANGFKAMRIGKDGWPVLSVAYVDQVLGAQPSARQRPPPDVKLDHLRGTTNAGA